MVAEAYAYGGDGVYYLCRSLAVVHRRAQIPRRVVVAYYDVLCSVPYGAFHHGPRIYRHFARSACAEKLSMQYPVVFIEAHHVHAFVGIVERQAFAVAHGGIRRVEPFLLGRHALGLCPPAHSSRHTD